MLTAAESDRLVLHCVAGFKPSSSSLSSKYTQLCQQLSAFQHTVGTLYQDSACMAHWRPTSRLIVRAASRGEHQFKRGPLTLKIICVGAVGDHLAMDTSKTIGSPTCIYRRGCQELGFFFLPLFKDLLHTWTKVFKNDVSTVCLMWLSQEEN